MAERDKRCAVVQPAGYSLAAPVRAGRCALGRQPISNDRLGTEEVGCLPKPRAREVVGRTFSTEQHAQPPIQMNVWGPDNDVFRTRDPNHAHAAAAHQTTLYRRGPKNYTPAQRPAAHQPNAWLPMPRPKHQTGWRRGQRLLVVIALDIGVQDGGRHHSPGSWPRSRCVASPATVPGSDPRAPASRCHSADKRKRHGDAS